MITCEFHKTASSILDTSSHLTKAISILRQFIILILKVLETYVGDHANQHEFRDVVNDFILSSIKINKVDIVIWEWSICQEYYIEQQKDDELFVDHLIEIWIGYLKHLDYVYHHWHKCEYLDGVKDNQKHGNCVIHVGYIGDPEFGLWFIVFLLGNVELPADTEHPNIENQIDADQWPQQAFWSLWF